MKLSQMQSLELPATADMHVHLRQGEMMDLVVPLIRRGGVDTVFVMPNLQPPITSVAQALEYRQRLRALEPNVHYLMSLFSGEAMRSGASSAHQSARVRRRRQLHPSITPDVIAEAAAAGITGVKMYPQGVTTNSDSGVVSLDDYAAVFFAMETHDLVLNLHGELATPPPDDVSLEVAFLPTLQRIHQNYPRLRIVLEHCSTAEALAAVRACGPTVAATITAHHLYLTGDMSHTDPHAFCKPIPKSPADRDALIKAICSGDAKFFFGSDSAPHPLSTKTAAQHVPAGVFTQPFATQLVLLALEEAVKRGVIADHDIKQDGLERFLSRSGRRFYKLPADDGLPRMICERKGEHIPSHVPSGDGQLKVGLSKAASPVFSLRWLP